MAGAALRMPKLGLTMTEGLLAAWKVAAGDKVQAGDVLYTVETDKIATDIEATADGEILSIEVAEGETCPVGTALATWTGPASSGDEAAGEDMPPEAAPLVEAVATPRAAVEPRAEGERIVATPLARRIAGEASVDLATISGSGENGRIKARDIEAAKSAPAPAVTESAPVAVLAPPAVAAPMAAVAPFFVMGHADIGKLGTLRDDLNASGGSGRASIGVTHMLIAAVSRAMIEMPEANAVWDRDAVLRYADIDVAITEGAVAPVLRDAARSSLRNIVDRSEALLQRANDNALSDEDLRGGAIAVSAGAGASMLVPSLSAGRSSALGVGGVEQVFRPDAAGSPKLCEEINLVLACDPRVWDAGGAARFLDRLRDLIENPLHLLL